MSVRADMTGWVVGRLFHAMARVRTRRPLSARERYYALMARGTSGWTEEQHREAHRQTMEALTEMMKTLYLPRRT